MACITWSLMATLCVSLLRTTVSTPTSVRPRLPISKVPLLLRSRQAKPATFAPLSLEFGHHNSCDFAEWICLMWLSSARGLNPYNACAACMLSCFSWVMTVTRMPRKPFFFCCLFLLPTLQKVFLSFKSVTNHFVFTFFGTPCKHRQYRSHVCKTDLQLTEN